MRLLGLALLACGVTFVAADTPANCTYDETRGWWTFTEGPRTGDRNIVCDDWSPGRDATKFRVFLEFPNMATDESGNKGTWTLIYNQGFELIINFRRYFAFSNYTKTESLCESTKAGWAHDVLGHNWACFEGRKDDPVGRKALQAEPLRRQLGDVVDPFNSEQFVELVNNLQNSWTAKVHEPFRGKTLNEMMTIRGGHRNRQFRNPPPAPVTEEQKKLARNLPEEFDWRNVSGVNYVSPIRDQGGCGSCYAFASMALLESRLRIATNNKVKRVFSPQDVVSCSPYSQGCSGGFPYLIGGKYAQDYGVVDEECNPYQGRDGPCKTKSNCTRQYVAKYRYCGGYYGASNEEVMKIALVHGGPVAVGFEVYPDFQTYHGGIYQHTTVHRQIGGPFDPFELTNHAVLVVGYGKDAESGLPYWTVKNSWGEGWGEGGFFRILRGADECGIESLAVEVEPIP